MKGLFLIPLAVLVAGCGIDPVKMNTSDGSARYFMKCGDDKGACVTKANELCPKGYTTSNETNNTHMSFNGWRGSSDAEISLEVQCN